MQTRATPDPLAPAPRRGAAARALRTITMDVTPLRESRDFRLLFVGQGVSFAGSMVTYVAVPFQVYALTRSSLLVGLVSLAELVPILLMAFVGGALADSVDRRRMVILTEAALLAATVTLLLNALLRRSMLWLVFLAVALAAGVDALQRPSLDALVPRVVEREQVPAAGALVSLRGNVGQVAGPAVAGILIATLGLPAAFAVDAATFAVSLLALSLMHAAPPPPESQGISLRSMRAGLDYARRRQDLLGTYAIDMNAMLFGMPTALFPQIATRFGGAAVLGVLYTAPAAGALLLSASSGWIRSVTRHGRAIAVSAGAWGAAIVLFGIAPTLWLALAALALAGAADDASGLFRMAVWNQSIPDAMRGRLAAIEMLSYTSGPSLGNVEAGAVAALAGVRASVVSGGVLCIAGTILLSTLLPRFWLYDARQPPPPPSI